jgi:hypothetical protein
VLTAEVVLDQRNPSFHFLVPLRPAGELKAEVTDMKTPRPGRRRVAQCELAPGRSAP